MSPLYEYSCSRCDNPFTIDLKIEDRDSLIGRTCNLCREGILIKNVTSCSFKIKGASAKNGYSTNVKDIEKRLGREITNDDLDD
jgi:DNA-directed RNA polymerase subunit RPC12/RpoP